MSQTLCLKLKAYINLRAAVRSHRRLGAVVRLDQTINDGTAGTAAATGAARVTHVASAARAIGNASSDRGVVDDVAVTHKHAFSIAPRN